MSALTPSLGRVSEAADAHLRRRPRNNFSYVSGATDEPLRFVTVSQALDEVVAAHGSRAAAIFSADREVLTWKDLQRLSDEVAAALLALGIRRGHRVGILSPNRREWLTAQFGAARIGAVLVSLNSTWLSTELESALNTVGCTALVAARSCASNNALGLLRSLAPELDRPGANPVLESRRLPHLKHVIVLGEGLVPARAERFSDFIRRAHPNYKRRLPQLAAALDPDDAINIQFTRGTEGAPKAVTLSHFNIVNNARHAARELNLTEVDKLCIVAPLFDGLGMVLGVLACVATGATMVFPSEVFDAERTLDAVSRHRCTALHGVPAMFEAMLDQPDLADYDTSSLRTGIITGAPCSGETLQRVIEGLGMDEVTVAYGMTEAGPVSFQSTINDGPEALVGTVGRVHANIEAKVVDRDGQIVPVGCTGELCIRGYAVMRGYWGDSKRTLDMFDEAGWMHSGDLATIDADGCCRIVGKVKDMLICGANHVAPQDIENLIRLHPKVDDVRVFGLPGARHGDEVCAWLVLKPGAQAVAEEIRAFCRGKVGQEFVPRHVRFVAEYPITAAGRVDKNLMRNRMLSDVKVLETRTA